jgi:very-short-patch-repair endonuclease
MAHDRTPGPPGRTAPDARVAEWAAGQHGRVEARQLAAAGLSDGAIARRLVKGQLHRVHIGVYAVGHPGETLHAQFMAAVLAGGEGAVLSHWSAGVLWGVLRWHERPVDVTVRGSGGRRRPGIRFHRSRTLAERDIVRRHGIPVVSVARMLLEIAPQLSDRRLRRVLRQALAEGLVSVRQIRDVVRRGNGHRGVKRLAALIDEAPAPTRSGHEDDVLDLLLAAGLEHPDINRPLVVGGVTYKPDMRWAAQRLILEVDSSWHDDPVAQACDAERQAHLEAFGERVLRTRREQALADPRQLVARLVAAGAPRAADSNQRAPALAMAGARTRSGRGM